MAQVVLENVYKSFPNRKAENVASKGAHRTESVNVLRRINLTVKDGEFMVMVGPSGCGKSTLLRLIAGLEDVTGGNISVGNRLVNYLPPSQRNIAMVFQNYALYPHMTVYDNIAFGLRLQANSAEKQQGKLSKIAVNLLVATTKKLPKGLRYVSDRENLVNEKVSSVAQLLQIEELLNRYPKELSGGQRQRVALGRAIARNPQVFLMDEPLSNLDAKLRTQTRAQIVKLQRQLGITTIYVTHDQTEAMTMGDRVAILDRGEIIQVSPPLEIYNRPANRFVAEFIGSPPMNFITVKFQSPCLITKGDFRLTLPEAWGSALRKYNGRTLILGVRPEHWHLSLPATKNLPAQVEWTENLGNDSYLAVKLIETSFQKEYLTTDLLQVRLPPEKLVNRGEKVWLSLNPEKIHFFDPETELAISPKSNYLSLPFE
ncbi:ABC transporter ATP-binding protein [Plectonema cf. radiosum LEGE 06105]|uniref:ABC transporter ATP-binding protein n=1 Tax=Plectonema cf. radiosum LEGE 06105 TaxID=945769 RepID=A0A8J7F4S1_9CYAN|nr:ABC transporter ATP-binding protein [Plectonema radiosum]MBE9214218.1 ABC transporter ATP-binding protein [Plectonema cf. radiosum LEGE 06105]